MGRKYPYIVLVYLLFVNGLSKESVNPYPEMLQQVLQFKPGTLKSLHQKQFGTGKKIEIQSQQFYEYLIKKLGYSLKVLVFYGELANKPNSKKSLGFYLSFPSHFSHQHLFLALQQRFGKQQKYYNRKAQSFYQWSKLGDKLKLNYHAGCTITCFPIYLNFYAKGFPREVFE